MDTLTYSNVNYLWYRPATIFVAGTHSFGQESVVALAIRILAVFLLAAVLAATVSWTLLPHITSSILTRALYSNGWELEDFLLRRPVDLNLHLDEIRLVDQAGSITLEASDIVLKPASSSFSRMAIDIGHLTITVAGSDEESPIELQSLLGAYLSILPQTVHQGEIHALRLCLPSLSPCINTKLTWWHDATGLQSRFKSGEYPSAYYLHLAMTDHSSRIEFFQSGSKAIAAELQITWPEMNILHIAGVILSTDDTSMESALPSFADEVSIELHALLAVIDLQLPLETIQQVSDLTDHISGDINVDVLGNFKWGNDEISLESNQPLTVNLKVAPDEATIHVAPNWRVNALIPDIAHGVAINQQDIICHYRLSMNDATCSSNDLSITVNYLSAPLTATLLVPEFVVELPGQNAMSADASIELVVREDDDSRLNAQGRITLRNNEITLVSDSLVADGLPFDRFELVHSLTSDSGELHSGYTGKTSALGQWFESPIAGDIRLEQEVKWHGSFDAEWQNWPVTINSRLNGSNLAGEIDGYIFKGGEFELALTGWLPLTTPEPVRMSWQEIEVGFPMQNTSISFDLSLDPDSRVIDIQGTSLQTEVLGGTVSSDNFAYNSDPGDGHLMLDLDNLDLLQVLSLEQEDFHAEGKLNGRLPVIIKKNQVYIKDGAIEALAPGGIIQYDPGDSVTGLVESNSQMALVVDTLKNFRYDMLKSKVNFGTDGILHLSTSLAGSNPEFEGGRRINFNLDVEENIAALLESLRLSEDITKRISEKYDK
jgi:hypothetical protein